ncbi:UDP-N-acetylglucosamine 2-epimerase [Gracilibacillus kekensis]|uniref:GDP/UDP-N,N'-diacetylbacillosamine 2-epimerase (Hydrolysing) n=1 Tax=Gracilibacillus kekensis TaxID=1027249 RepID=A0A1M7K7T0_9BACI|nr:UDP-N-acetylglucosamine 2-epimerase [Gracilibacillus kekensis]SHM61043.1 GDP/UDP-N,N'-diacetylbacillosamine 2-epimerase (hydrolysing) [Gracilibacillus kekensis]
MINPKRNICVITGTRADYGIYYPIISTINENENLNLQILATGMHLSPYHGNTLKEIENDHFTISDKVDILLQGSTGENMAKSIGIGIIGMTQSFQRLKPDIVLVLGDRGEMLSAAISASHMNIPVAHIHGGEVSGSIDESVRHAITKLSHIHFPSTDLSAERISKLGEDQWRIFKVGAPRIDTIKTQETPQTEDVLLKHNIVLNNKDYYLFVFHPVTTEVNDVKSQIQICMSSLSQLGKDVIIIMPNSDAGNEDIIIEYENYKKYKYFHFVTNFSPMEYLTILKNSLAIIGNSSSGIIEAASFKKPVINIGNRQIGRERSENVIDVDCNKDDLLKAIKMMDTQAFSQKLTEVKNVYGEGNASQKIIEVITSIEIDNALINKKISY